jgi:hypothetical protein
MHLSVAAHAINHVTGDQGASIGAKSMCMQELKNRSVFLKKKTFGFPKNHRFLKKSNGYRFLLSNLKFEFSIKNQKPVNYLINQKNRLIFNKTNRFLIF